MDDAAVAVCDGRVAWVGRQAEWNGKTTESIDGGGAAVIPGLADPLTHIISAGDRLDNFEARATGRVVRGNSRRRGRYPGDDTRYCSRRHRHARPARPAAPLPAVSLHLGLAAAPGRSFIVGGREVISCQ